MDITEPLILSRGSHQPGSGQGCAMNVIAWELGGDITDFPENVHPLLALTIQEVNDFLACRFDPTLGFVVPPKYASRLLDIAHLATGTGIGAPPKMTNGTALPAAMAARRHGRALAEAFLAEHDDIRREFAGVRALAGVRAHLVHTDTNAPMVRDTVHDRLLDALEAFVILVRTTLGLPERPQSAPTVAEVNAALRKMAEVR